MLQPGMMRGHLAVIKGENKPNGLQYSCTIHDWRLQSEKNLLRASQHAVEGDWLTYHYIHRVPCFRREELEREGLPAVDYQT